MSLLPFRARAESGSVLELPRTGLRIQDGELQRINADGAMLLRIPVTDIRAISLRWRFDFMAIIILLTTLGLAAVAYYVSESNILSSILYIIAVLGFGLTVFGFFAHRLVIETADGTISIQYSDQRDEAESFVVGVRRIVRTGEFPPRRGPEPERETGIRDLNG